MNLSYRESVHILRTYHHSDTEKLRCRLNKTQVRRLRDFKHDVVFILNHKEQNVTSLNKMTCYLSIG